VSGKLQDLNKYDAYKPLVEHEVPLDTIQQALWLANQFETNPEEVIRHAINQFGLDNLLQEQGEQVSGQQQEEELELDPDDPLNGLQDHPLFQQLQERAQRLEEWEREQQALMQEEEASEQLDQFIAGLHNEHGDFDDLYVTALMANGMDPKDAVQQFKDLVQTHAQQLAETLNPGQQSQEQPPVVMGGAGNAGSGLPEPPTSLGKLSKGATADLAEQFIRNQMQQNQ
jgi:hypothetical protein